MGFERVCVHAPRRPCSRAQRIVVDARGHLLGRLAATVAKQLLEGQRLVIVRCEEINISGRHIRNKCTRLCMRYPHASYALDKFMRYLDKRRSINPSRGPFHQRSPSKIFFKTVRGMLPHKTPRGALALSKLQVFEGVPPPYDRVKRVVVPSALRVLRLKPMRRFTHLGKYVPPFPRPCPRPAHTPRLASEVGWTYGDVVAKLEERRKVKAAAWYSRQKELSNVRRQAVDKTKDQVSKETATLQSLVGTL